MGLFNFPIYLKYWASFMLRVYEHRMLIFFAINVESVNNCKKDVQKCVLKCKWIRLSAVRAYSICRAGVLTLSVSRLHFRCMPRYSYALPFELTERLIIFLWEIKSLQVHVICLAVNRVVVKLATLTCLSPDVHIKSQTLDRWLFEICFLNNKKHVNVYKVPSILLEVIVRFIKSQRLAWIGNLD